MLEHSRALHLQPVPRRKELKMSERHSTTLRTAGVHVYKYNVTNAHRIVRMLNDERTPHATRRALRDNLRRIAACTDIDVRDALRVESVAVLLRIGITYHPGRTWQRAHAAHVRLWEAFNAQDRIVNPRRWVMFDRIMSAYRERQRAARRQRARRASRPRVSARPVPAARAAV